MKLRYKGNSAAIIHGLGMYEVGQVVNVDKEKAALLLETGLFEKVEKKKKKDKKEE